ncbi:2116_t:CDS:2 [Funneliformis geosporum]|nr:2116_t:CDS:2 [Funneliformis geosporum]
MAIKNEGSTERINGTYHYVLRLYGHLINGQKALVTLIDIQVFFDILVSDGETPDECEEKERMTGKFETKEKILKWKYCGKIGTKSENNFMMKGKKKNTDEEGIIWGSGEEVEKKKDYMGAIKIKITAEEDFFSSFLKLPQCVLIDIRVCLKKRYPHSEVEKEGGKKRPSPLTARKMREVANYYIIDALRCQELLVKLSQINNYREVASIAHVFLFDSHYRANGMKVRNLLGAYAFKRDIVFSSRVCENIEKGKYPGAYVFPPEKVIETRRPVKGLDFALLYPSLIMAYNLSPDKIILTHEEADIAKKMKTFYIRLKDLSNKRLELKACLTPLGKKRQHLEKIISSAKKRGKRIPESLNSEYSFVCFDYDYWDLKQKALKVYMNTFYREADNSKSPIFLHELAEGTTSTGKYNLNLVVEFVIKKGFGIKYGDTVSLYLTCPDKYYEKWDEAFSRKDLSKEAY